MIFVAVGAAVASVVDLAARRTHQAARLRAESEILSWLGKGRKVEDILLGVHQSIASRSIGLLRRVGIEPEVTFTGGVAKNVGMIKTLESGLGVTLNVSPEAHYMGALGAALFALDHIRASRAPARAGAAS